MFSRGRKSMLNVTRSWPVKFPWDNKDSIQYSDFPKRRSAFIIKVYEARSQLHSYILAG